MSRGDKTEILVDTGAGTSRPFFVEANANGRKVEVRAGKGDDRGFVIVELQTRTGVALLTQRFMVSRVIALIETKVEEPEDDARPRRGRARPAADAGQDELTL